MIGVSLLTSQNVVEGSLDIRAVQSGRFNKRQVMTFSKSTSLVCRNGAQVPQVGLVSHLK